jgi:hypothetical protein
MAAEPSCLNVNPKIGKRGPKGTYNLHIVFRNIANSVRDEQGSIVPWLSDEHKLSSPLEGRIQFVIDELNELNKKCPIDAFVVLEAGRPSGSLSWTDMAAMIEKQTGLTYMGIWMLNGTAMSFGKALFINRSRMFLRRAEQRYTSSDFWMPSGPGFGADIVILSLSPVENGLVVVDRGIECWVLHAPVDPTARSIYNDYVRMWSRLKGDIFFGDCNSFPNSTIPEISETLSHLKEWTPADVECTFAGFEQDVFAVPIDKRDQYGPPNEIVYEKDSTLWVRPSSVLDRVFADHCINVSKVEVHPITRASDHAMISIYVTI